MRTEVLKTWTNLKSRIHELKEEAQASAQKTSGSNQSRLLFRGQGSAGWKLETSFDRTNPKRRWLEDYYRRMVAAKTVVESLLPRGSAPIDLQTISNALRDQTFFPQPLPHYDLLVHLRHHGFPSPFLDWSASPYVASYFAFEQPQGEQVALYVYQEFVGMAKTHAHDAPHLVSFGPFVQTHPRHVLQQAQYTMAASLEAGAWKIAAHEDVFALGSESQDKLLKLVVPSSEASIALDDLDEMNISAYSLFQTEDSLFRTLGRRIFRDA